ncbi:MAG: hypothetical protein Q9164_003396 [Protoblastenia rupestris]
MPNLGEGLKGKTGTSIASSGYELLDNHEIFSQHESLIYPYHHDNLSSSTSSATYSQPSKLSSQSSVTSLPDPFGIQKAPLMECTSHLTKSTFEDLIEFIDASTQDLLFGHKMFGRSGISQPSNEEHPTLCRLAPGVFCPNYSKALSQRGSLTANIANSLSRISRRSQSTILKSKLGLLKHLRPERYTPSESHSSENLDQYANADLKRAIQARLWFLMRDKLFDATAFKGIKPLKTRHVIEHSLPASEGLLEEDIVDSQSVNAIPGPDEMETDLLLEDEESLLLHHSQDEDPTIFEGEDCETIFDSPEGAHSWSDEILFEGDLGVEEEQFWEGLDADATAPHLHDSPSEYLLESSMQNVGDDHHFVSGQVDQSLATRRSQNLLDDQVGNCQGMPEVGNPDILLDLMDSFEDVEMLLDN